MRDLRKNPPKKTMAEKTRTYHQMDVFRAVLTACKMLCLKGICFFWGGACGGLNEIMKWCNWCVCKYIDEEKKQ